SDPNTRAYRMARVDIPTFQMKTDADTNKCIDLDWWTRNTLNGGNISLQTCIAGGDARQRWWIDGGRIRNAYSSACLDMDYTSWLNRVNGVRVQQWGCNGQQNQQWRWRSSTDPYPYTIWTQRDMCLDY